MPVTFKAFGQPVKRPTVLLADDEKALLDRIRRLVESHCVVVGEVEDGQSLLTAVERLQPDIVLSDISMPGLNGFQAARLIKKVHPNVRIVFLTVHEEPVAITEAFALGIEGYVIKRFAASDLVPAIREVIQGRSYVSPAIRRRTIPKNRKSNWP